MGEHFWLGMAVIFLSGILNGSFPLPMKYARQWRWENTWLVFALVALLLVPWLMAAGFLPNLGEIYHAAGGKTVVYTAIFGFLWGIAQVTFGLGISAVGMALAFAVVAGLSCLSGSLVPVLVLNPADLFRPRGILLLASIPILFAGLALYAWAGRRREREQPAASETRARPLQSFKKGLGICIFTGIFGSNINLGFAFGGDIARRAGELGGNPLASSYAIWAIILSAGFVPNLLYCLYLLSRNGTWALFARRWPREALLGVAMGLLWLSGILGYGIGSVLVGKYGTSVGYAFFTASIILAANVLGILTGEWKGASSHTRKVLAAGVAVLLISVVVLNLGGLF
jgi:L-rhamnose-H+ transport protein